MAPAKKKVALLGSTKQAKPSSTNQSAATASEQAPSGSSRSAASSAAALGQASASKNSWLKPVLFVFILLVVIASVLPKPKLITYEKEGAKLQSIYWTGWLNDQPQLFDSELAPALDENRQELVLCNDPLVQAEQRHCVTYHIVRIDGMVAAWQFARQRP